jgi:hypothetical protein
MTTRPRAALHPAPPPTVPRQLSMALDSVRLRGMSPSERAMVVARLANLLMEAADPATGERDDDRH